MNELKEYTFEFSFRDGGSIDHKVYAKTYDTAFVAAASETDQYGSRVEAIRYVDERVLIAGGLL